MWSCPRCARRPSPYRADAPRPNVSLDGKQAPAFELESTAGDTVSLAETLESGPTVVLVNRGHWCSFCAEQLGTFGEVSYDLWFHDGVDILPVQLLADPEGE